MVTRISRCARVQNTTFTTNSFCASDGKKGSARHRVYLLLSTAHRPTDRPTRANRRSRARARVRRGGRARVSRAAAGGGRWQMSREARGRVGGGGVCIAAIINTFTTTLDKGALVHPAESLFAAAAAAITPGGRCPRARPVFPSLPARSPPVAGASAPRRYARDGRYA